MEDERGADADPNSTPAGSATAGAKKRARSGRDGGDLKRVAEIVMVLSTMGKMRGGRDPTPVERALAAEAKEWLTGMCEAVNPKDLFSRDAVRVVVDDLGLNKPRDPPSGYRPPKISIAEKLSATKKKLEDKESAALCSPQPQPLGFGANSDSPGMLHGTPRYLPDRPSPMALSTGGFQSALPVVHVPDLAFATTSLKQSQVNDTQLAATALKSSSTPLETDPLLLTVTRKEAAHYRSDARSIGPAYLTQVRATASSAEYAPAKSSTTSATVKLGQVNNFLDHTQLRSEGAHDSNAFLSSHQAMRSQEKHTSIIQAIPANLFIGNQPSQDLMFMHAPSYLANHNDIAKTVQMVLQQKFSDHPVWDPPSIDYMTRPLNCQICRITIHDVETLLVCDACEKGTHLKCLPSSANKNTPKAEWHCPKCLITSNGKLLPPKYGRVTRSVVASKASPNTGGTHVSSEKRVENPDSKVNHQKLASSENSGLLDPAHASNMISNHSESAPDSKATSTRKLQGFDFLTAVMKREDGMYIGTSAYQSKERDAMVCATPGKHSGSSDMQVENSELPLFGMQTSTSESTLDSKIVTQRSYSENHTSETTHRFQTPSESQACYRMEVPTSVEISTNQLHEISEPSTDELKPCDVKETPEYDGDCDIRPQDQENSPASPNGASGSGDAAMNCGRPSIVDLHTVEWFGDILESVEDKTYYWSCRVNGALHKLQDHVLTPSRGCNLYPSKLQSMWEDRKTGSKWATVDPYYFPSDLPEHVDRPSTPENCEVYASNNGSTIMVGSIRGPCEVLPIDKFREERERRTQLGDTISGLHPIFMCRWLYDESKAIFQCH